MEIRWLGDASFELKGTAATVVTDPPPSLVPEAHVVLQSRRSADAPPTASGQPFLIDGPGEYEVRGVFVVGTEGPSNALEPAVRHTLYTFILDEIRVAHVGPLIAAPHEAAVEALGGVDVLLLPLGGTGLNAAAAAEIVGMLEPSIVVPAAPNDDPALKSFQRETGAADVEVIDVFRALPNRMPEETQVVLLRRSGTA